MKKEVKNVDITAITLNPDYINSNEVDITIAELPDTKITVRKVIPLEDVVSFAEYVVNNCIDITTGEYTPEGFAFSMRDAVIRYFTNVIMPEGLSDRYELLYRSSLFSSVLNVINKEQYRSIKHMITEKIAFLKEEMLSVASKASHETLSRLEELMDKVTVSIGQFESLDQGQINSLLNVITSLKNTDEKTAVDMILNYHHKNAPVVNQKTMKNTDTVYIDKE